MIIFVFLMKMPRCGFNFNETGFKHLATNARLEVENCREKALLLGEFPASKKHYSSTFAENHLR